VSVARSLLISLMHAMRDAPKPSASVVLPLDEPLEPLLLPLEPLLLPDDPLLPLEPLLPDDPLLPLEPLLPDDPLLPLEPLLPDDPLLPELPLLEPLLPDEPLLLPLPPLEPKLPFSHGSVDALPLHAATAAPPMTSRAAVAASLSLELAVLMATSPHTEMFATP
jgi:hypothetical protein